MNGLNILVLKSLRKLYTQINPGNLIEGRNWKMFSQKEYANELIYQYLMNDQPCMIARFGSTEMLSIVNYKGVVENRSSLLAYVQGKSLPWWWDNNVIDQMFKWSGFFPKDEKRLHQFGELMVRLMPEVDVLGSWLNQEKLFSRELYKAKKVVLEDLEPFFAAKPWTRALAGKKVLVVHPFAEAIESQYSKRDLLFNDGLLPEFELHTIKAVQSLGGDDQRFSDWFEALDFMKDAIDRVDYDICIIGCGAYGFPLAAHVKKQGKKAVHLAGVTQLLFGIIGKRWEEFIVWPYTNLFNEHWVRPGDKQKPRNAQQVEGACYW